MIPKKVTFRRWLQKLPATVRKKFGLAAAISLSVVVSLVIGGLFLGAYATLSVYEQKQRDTWAIMFLELERHAELLSRKITNVTTSQRPDLVELYEIQEESDSLIKIRASTSSSVTIQDLGLKSLSMLTEHNVLQLAGQNYIADTMNSRQVRSRLHLEVKNEAKYLALWPIDFSQWMATPNPQSGNVVYVITRQGRLLHANKSNIKAGNVASRELVQKFIKNPVAQGQFEFISKNERETYGFVQEIPQTNVVIFSEVPVTQAFAGMQRIIGRFGFVLGIALIISLFIIYIPISKVVGTINGLTRHAKRVAAGDFSGADMKSGFGEFAVLVSTFNHMRKSLVHRDKTIESLMEEQKHKVRLESEVEIAKTIQQNLLSDDKVPKEARVDISTLYIPAEECAGDWYSYFYDQENDEVIFIIADVSGHGTGSSMFTAIIAGLTEQARTRPGAFDVDLYTRDLNTVIRKLGKSKWHATMLIAKFFPKRQVLELVNCGHSFPSVVYPADSKHKSKTISIPSMILGVVEECKTGRKEIPFESGAQMLMYTDGLEEARTSSGKQFGRKRIHSLCMSASESPKQQVGSLHAAWTQHLGDGIADDDMCLLSVKAV